MSFTLNKKGNLIQGVINFKSFSIPYQEDVFNQLSLADDLIYNAKTPNEEKEYLRKTEEFIQSCMDSIEKPKNSYISENIKYNEEDGKYYLIAPNGTVSMIAIPTLLIEKMISARHENLDIDPYIKAWTLFLRNPNFSLNKAEYFAQYLSAKFQDQELYDAYIAEGYSEEKAKEYSTYDEVSITRSGLISTYKYVDYEGANHNEAAEHYNQYPSTHAEDCIFWPPVMRKNGEIVYVDGIPQHNVEVGKIHELPAWSSVNCDDRTSCVKGLHVGSQTYIRCFGGRTSFLLNCLVSPSDIGAFVQNRGSADEGALRVIRYYPVSVNIAPNKGRYHESTLLDKVEEDWAKERQKAIDETNAKIAKLEQIKEQLNSF